MMRTTTLLLLVLNINWVLPTPIEFGEDTNGNINKIALTVERIEESLKHPLYPTSCAEIFVQGTKESGVYNIYPKPWLEKGNWFKKNPIRVYCDMDTDGGGWTVFQRRGNYESQENFYRNWDDYRRGFGNVERDFWLGNDNLYLLTNEDRVSLRVDLQDFEGNSRFAAYREFRVLDWTEKFRLQVGDFYGDAGDSLTYSNNVSFVTYDKDVAECSKKFKGGWWYRACHQSNLNGVYLSGNHTSFADGVNWLAWRGYHYSYKKSEMKIRPYLFSQVEV